ncbi:hypothetical protein [Micromonospora sp. WMMD708]|uniref:hypothetical protein n=1 Tax=Micromonospora sp. WMMD708 TaxID=3403464 RepID=UPI003BF59F3C
MSVRRQVTRVVTVGALLAGLVTLGALPAHADEDRVRVRASGGFSAGGSPGGVTIEVRKRTDGCVLLRTALGLSLAGVGADQVRVEVSVGGRWSTVPVTGGGGVLQVSRTSSAGPPLCKGKSSTVRYRVAFLAGAPAGRLDVVGEATTAVGRLIGRGADTSRVGGRAAGSPTPSPTPTRKPTPTPTPTTPEATTPAPTAAATGAALAAPAAGPAGTAAAETSGGSMTMFAGIALVILGAGLIALLIFRSRADRAAVDPGRATDAVDLPVLPQPRNPGPTTYRSGGAVAAPAPAPSGQVYGQPQPSAPARPGGLYGAPAAYPTVTPTPRPAGGVYGSRPATAPPAQGGPVSAPPAPTPPAAPPAQGGSVSLPPVPEPAPTPPAAPPAPPAAAPPAPGRPASPAAKGGEATTIMPELPG